MKAREETRKILQHFGCDAVGFMDEYSTGTLVLAFTLQGRSIQFRASAQGWATAYLQENPWSPQRKLNREEWKQKALQQGMIAVNSIIRDWVKGQVTAVETGVLTFEEVFMPYVLLPSGKTLLEHIQTETELLPAPT
jgi:hypothetical protein